MSATLKHTASALAVTLAAAILTVAGAATANAATSPSTQVSQANLTHVSASARTHKAKKAKHKKHRKAVHKKHRKNKRTTRPVATQARPFIAPAHTLASATCTKVDFNTWKVTYEWTVTGGQYLNLGNGEHYLYGTDNVTPAQSRTVVTSVTISPWSDAAEASAPETDTAKYDHWVAPIGSRAAAQNLTDYTEVNLNCA